VPLPRSAVWRFALLAIAWLVPCFAIWYLIAPWHARPIAWLARITINIFNEALIRGLEFDGAIARFVTNLETRAGGNLGDVLLELNPLVYTYGTAIVAALVLASRGGWKKLLLGIAILIPFQAWGIGFDVLAQVVRAGAQVASQAGLLGWKAELVALGYQLGSLMFPPVAPVLVWAVMQKNFIDKLVGSGPELT
jgi:hypothetical protein